MIVTILFDITGVDNDTVSGPEESVEETFEADEKQNNDDTSVKTEPKETYGKLEDRESRPNNLYKILYAKELAKKKGNLSTHNRTKKRLKHSKERENKLREKLKQEEAKLAHEKERVKHYTKLYSSERAKYSILSKQLKNATSPLKKEKDIKKGVKEFLASTSLPSAQQKCLLNPKQKWAKCSKEDIAQALVIRSLSPKTYNHLQQEFKNNRKLYYPTRQTLERHTDGMASCRPG